MNRTALSLSAMAGGGSAIGTTGFVTMGLLPALQARLMNVAGDAASLGASLNHSALNLANAAGAYLGGVVIEAGLGWTSPAWVGAALALGGLTLATVSLVAELGHVRGPAEASPAQASPA